MFPYQTPEQIRGEYEKRFAKASFGRIDKGVRAELEARLSEETEAAFFQTERPIRRFNFRSLWPRLTLWKLQRNLK